MARKTLWYKKAILGTIQNRTLQSAMTSALGVLATSGERIRRPEGDDVPRFELINSFAKRSNMLCGHFLNFEAGRSQLRLVGADTAASFSIEALLPPRANPQERSEFLEGVAYFGILGNHIILCQSKAASSREFERYLNWLLWEATTTLPSGTAVVVGDQPSKKLVDKINNNPIKSVSFGTPMEYEVTPAPSPNTRARVTEVKVSPTGLGAGVLEALFSDSIFSSAKFSDAITADNIEVEVTVRFKHKQHISESGDALLRTVAKAARHMAAEDVEIELHKAGTIKGDALRVHTSVDVATTESGLIVEADLNQRMATWLAELIESRMIDQ
jgi:hypothetical protein